MPLLPADKISLMILLEKITYDPDVNDLFASVVTDNGFGPGGVGGADGGNAFSKYGGQVNIDGGGA